ncbi:MAG TPA: FecR family protein [Flavihumibacter sp.]|jgi:transmembrane sensor
MNGEERDLKKDKIILSQREVYLLKGYFMKSLSEEEMEELDHWLMRDESNLQLFENLLEKEEMQSGLQFLDQLSYKPENRVAAYKILAAAAIVFIGVSVALYYLVFRSLIFTQSEQYAELKDGKRELSLNPTGIQLNTGRGDKILLGEGNDLAAYHNVSAFQYIKYDTVSGILEYQSNQSEGYDTIYIPHGRMLQLRLSDGTRIWLNASSQLVFPASAEKSQRMFELEGEAYFEVARRAGSGFEVKAGGLVIEATGTAFNINTATVKGIETALLSGRVIIKSDGTARELRQGKTLSWREGVFTEDNFDSLRISGWRTNQFVFRHTPLAAVLKEIETWYGVKAVRENNSSFNLNATIPRTIALPRLLSLMEQTGHAKFILDSDTIWVKNWSSE